MAATYTPTSVSIGDNIRREREARRLTQAQLAARAQMPQGQISNLESGRSADPSASTLIRVARAIGCAVDDLLIDVNPDYERRASERRAYYVALDQLAAAIVKWRNDKTAKARDGDADRVLRQAAASIVLLRAGMKDATDVTAADVDQRLSDTNTERPASNALDASDRFLRILGWAPALSDDERRLLTDWATLTDDDRRVLRNHLVHLSGLRRQQALPFSDAGTGAPTPGDPPSTPKASEQEPPNHHPSGAQKRRRVGGAGT